MVYLGLSLICWLISMIKKPQSGWTVLCYHGVQDDQAARFKQQMQYLAGRAVPVDRIGSETSGICLTFDDAFACVIDNVVPLVNCFQVPIAIFPVTDNFDAKPRWVMSDNHSEKDLRTMSKNEILSLCTHPLITFGSHTCTHPHLGQSTSEVVEQELENSRESLANLTGKSPVDLALPHGSFNPLVLASAQRIGYRRIYTLEPRVNRELPNDGRVGRFSVDPDMWWIEFQLTISGAYGYLLPFRKGIERLRFWKNPVANSPSSARPMSEAVFREPT